MQIKKLAREDAEAYQHLRLQGLKEFPLAFGSSYEESIHQPISQVVERLESGDAVFGAFDDQNELVGVVGVRQEQRCPYPRLRVTSVSRIILSG